MLVGSTLGTTACTCRMMCLHCKNNLIRLLLSYNSLVFREEYSLMNAAFQIIRGGLATLDVATVQTGDGGKCYMTLLANWGLVADVDIESEKFRKIGETRFVLGNTLID